MDIFAPIGKVLHVSPDVSKFIGGGFLLLAAAVYLAGSEGDVDPVWLALCLAGFSVLVVVLSGLPALARTLLAWLLTVLFAAYLVALFLQVLSGNRMPWSSLECLTGSFAMCSVELAPVPPAPEVATGRPPSDAGLEPPAPGPDPAAIDREGARVFVQFAGFARSDVVEISRVLVAEGWQVEGAERGGQRADSAAGLNEVRFFHAADQPLAEALAGDVARARDREVAVRDFSRTSVAAGARPGQLEVWISP